MRKWPKPEGKQVLLRSSWCCLDRTVNRGNNQQVCGDATPQTFGAINQRGEQHLQMALSGWVSLSRSWTLCLVQVKLLVEVKHWHKPLGPVPCGEAQGRRELHWRNEEQLLLSHRRPSQPWTKPLDLSSWRRFKGQIPTGVALRGRSFGICVCCSALAPVSVFLWHRNAAGADGALGTSSSADHPC